MVQAEEAQQQQAGWFLAAAGRPSSPESWLICSHLQGEGQQHPRPMIEKECVHLEWIGGCKVCKEIHPIHLCFRPDTRKIAQHYFEDRQKLEVAKRNREGHSGFTPDGKKPKLEPSVSSTASSAAGTSSSAGQRRTSELSLLMLLARS